MRRALTALVLSLLAVAPASAQALTLKASRPETGWIRLAVADAGAATHVAIDEQTPSGTEPVGDFTPTGGEAVIRHAADWRCDRRDRVFIATASLPDGTTQTAKTTLRTPSCRKRLGFSARRRHGRITVHVTDRWRIGDVTSKTCIAAPGHRTDCRTLLFSTGERAATRVIKARA